VNNAYIRDGTMHYSILEGWWADAGESVETLHQANVLVAQQRRGEA